MRARTPLIAAVLFVVLFAVATALIPDPPHVEDSGAAAVDWLKEHQDDVPTAAHLLSLAVIPFCVLVAWTRSVLPPMHGYAFLVAAGAFLSQALIQAWITAGLALHAGTVSPDTARTLLDIAAYFGPVLTTTDVVLAGAVALAVFSHAVLPRWVGYASAVFALEQLIESVTVYGDHGFMGPGGDFNAVLGADMFGVWVIVLGVGLAMKGRAQTAH